MAGHFISWFSFPEDGNYIYRVSLVAQLVKNQPAMQETQVQSLNEEDPPEKEMATHSCLGNPMDRAAWQATVHGVTNSQTQLGDFTHLYIVR